MRVPIIFFFIGSTLTLAASAPIVRADSSNKDSSAAEVSSTGRCGGGGGNKIETLTCPEGQYIAGIAVRGGAFIDQVSIACREIPVSGEPGSLGDYMSAGGGGGTNSKSGQCQAGLAVTDLSIRSGAYLDNMYSGRCLPRSDDGWGGRGHSIQLDAGGVGGIPCDFQCPGNEALYQLVVKSGGWVDSISGYCRK